MVTLRIDADEVDLGFGGLIDKLADRASLHRVIGEELLTSMLARYDAATAPDGSAWETHAPVTVLLRGNRQNALLKEKGDLYASLKAVPSEDKVEIGTDLDHPKVMTHQYGATIRPVRAPLLVLGRIPGGGVVKAEEVTIPARPYVGVGSGDAEMVRETLIDLLSP